MILNSTRYLVCVVGTLSLLLATSAQAETFVDKVWVRSTPAGAGNTAGYAIIMNSSQQTDRLVSISSPAAAKIELHQTKEEDGIMVMTLIEELVIAPGNQIELKPGGYHLMIKNVKQALKVGDTFPIVFKFEVQGNVNVNARVAPLAATAAP